MPNSRQLRWMRIRLFVVLLLLGAGAVLVTMRIFALQVSQSDWLRSLSREQYLKEIALEPMRGAITDRQGAPLAVSVMTDSVFAYPGDLAQPQQTARQLAQALDMDPKQLARALTTRKHFTWIKRRISPIESARLRTLDLSGIHFTRESRRFYPARELAASVIGFAGDGRGLEGLEMWFDGQLRGSTVLAQGLRDARGNVLFADAVGQSGSMEGVKLTLTIDSTIQEIVEAELGKAVRSSGARQGTGVVLDPFTGEILAMANVPLFNPNTYWKYKTNRFRNRALTDCFEPGSTMKVFTLGKALQLGAVKPDEEIDCESGRMVIGRHTIHDASHKGHGVIPLEQVLVQSSNIGTAKIGMRLGKQTLYRSLREFGFGQVTGVSFPGESRCQLRKPDAWSDVGLATISFGQGVSVTALQLTAAMAAVANGGVLMQPRLIREVRDPNGRLIRGFEPEPHGRVLDRKWTRALTRMMVKVTAPDGTGSRAAIPGFDVAGKTGTAQKIDPIAGGYSKDKRVASFIGFVPAESPRFVALVVIDEPTTSPYGGVVAAPAFARMTEAILSYLGVFSSRSDARVAAKEASGESQADEAPVLQDQVVVEETRNRVLPEGATRMPDVRGLSLRRAIALLSRKGMDLSIEGSGRVVRQRPAAGSAVKVPAEVSLMLERRTGHRGRTPVGSGFASHGKKRSGNQK